MALENHRADFEKDERTLEPLRLKKIGDMSPAERKAFSEAHDRRAMLIEEARAAATTEVTARSGVVTDVKSTGTETLPSAETKLDRFGLPVGWARQKSEEALAQIRTEGIYVLPKIVNEYRKELKILGFPSPQGILEEKDYQSTQRYLDDIGATRHLLLTPEERITLFSKSGLIKGMRMQDSDRLADWREVLPYELFVIVNHSKTLPEKMNDRGGLTPREVLLIHSGIGMDNSGIGYDRDAILAILESEGVLVK